MNRIIGGIVMEKWCKMLVVLLCIILASNNYLSVSGDIVSDYFVEFDLKKAISQSKIDNKVYEKANENGKVTVYIWLDDIE